MAERWLTLKRSKETGELFGFLWQGDKEKNPKEQVLELIETWNNDPKKSFTWELCENRDILCLLKGKSHDSVLKEVAEALSEVEDHLQQIRWDIDDIKDKLGELEDDEE